MINLSNKKITLQSDVFILNQLMKSANISNTLSKSEALDY